LAPPTHPRFLWSPPRPHLNPTTPTSPSCLFDDALSLLSPRLRPELWRMIKLMRQQRQMTLGIAYLCLCLVRCIKGMRMPDCGLSTIYHVLYTIFGIILLRLGWELLVKLLLLITWICGWLISWGQLGFLC
jgi:hypothetical protein